MRGFTLIEILTVMALLMLIGAFIIPYSYEFYQLQKFEDITSNIITNMNKARNQALFQKSDSPFGVKFFSGYYVVFEGNAYATRNTAKDERFDLPNDLIISGLDEVIFHKLTAIPAAAGNAPLPSETININLGKLTKTINIDKYGKIE